ncbi:unnamed protein product, partial [Cyprideis torosa]
NGIRKLVIQELNKAELPLSDLVEILRDSLRFPPEEETGFHFIDLFAGIGGFRMALQNLGGGCVFSSEWDKSAQKTYYQNYGELPFGDIRGFTNSVISDSRLSLMIPGHDILAAGFPCQPFSHAGVSARTAVGSQHGFECETQDPIPLKSILEENVPERFTISDKLWEGHINRTRRNVERGTGFTAYTANLDRPSNTIVARYGKDGKECLVPQEGKNPRLLTPRECARLQGYPDNFWIPEVRTPAYKQFGNSVAVPVITRLAKEIIKGSLSSIQQHAEVLKGLPEWAERNKKGNSMYDAGLNAFLKFVGYFFSKTPLPKPFILLAGISGTGKSRYVRKQAEASDPTGKNYC